MLNKTLFPGLIIFILLCSCSVNNKKYKATTDSDSNSICFEDIENLSFKIKSIPLNPEKVNYQINCVGKIISSPDETAVVSMPIEGTIKKLFISPGKYVAKGVKIASIENSDILNLQEEYLVITSKYAYYKEDFKRQGELNLENATSMKIMQKAEYEFKTSEARMQSLKKKLELIGINPDSVEQNKFQATINIFAPISGYVSKINVTSGMFCNMETPLCMILGNQRPIIVLLPDESEIGFITPGQTVEFMTQINPGKKYKATITGIEPNNEWKETSSVFAQIQEPNETFQIGTSVKACIAAGDKLLLTIPVESVISRNGQSFIFRKTKVNCFELLEITTVKTIDKRIEILNNTNLTDNNEVVIEGARNILLNYDLLQSNVR